MTDLSSILRTFDKVIRLLDADKNPGPGWTELERQITNADPGDLSQNSLSKLLFYVEEYLSKFQSDYAEEFNRIDNALSRLIRSVVVRHQHMKYSYDRRPQIVMAALERRIAQAS